MKNWQAKITTLYKKGLSGHGSKKFDNNHSAIIKRCLFRYKIQAVDVKFTLSFKKFLLPVYGIKCFKCATELKSKLKELWPGSNNEACKGGPMSAIECPSGVTSCFNFTETNREGETTPHILDCYTDEMKKRYLQLNDEECETRGPSRGHDYTQNACTCNQDFCNSPNTGNRQCVITYHLQIRLLSTRKSWAKKLYYSRTKLKVSAIFVENWKWKLILCGG